MKYDFSIPCPHELNKVRNYRIVLPDYHPLSKKEVESLMTEAVKGAKQGGAEGSKLVTAVQVRLRQSIKGSTCPNTQGESSTVASAMSEYYLSIVRSGENFDLDKLMMFLN